MKIEEVKKKYKNKWVLAEVLKVDKLDQPTEIKPIRVSDDRDEVYEAIGTVPKGSSVMTLYTGEVTGVFLFFTKKR